MNQMPTAHAAVHSAIDKEIDASKQLTRSLSRYKALTPISTLPPELLSRIFRLHAREDPPLSPGLHRLGWIAVTHVCRHWRQVALKDPLSWSRIMGFSPSAEWVAEMLVRAQNTPLAIDLEDKRNPGILAMISRHLSRTRELRLRGLSFLHFDGVQDLCGLEAPELEDLELGISTASTVNFREIAGAMLFKGQAQKLRTLSLSQLYIPWSHIPRGQLTQLKIKFLIEHSRADFRHSLPDDLDQLIDLLINSPQLESLVLDFCLPPMLSQVPHGQPIHLPCLSRLCLGGSTSRVTNLWKRLILPSSATLRLRCKSENPPTQSVHLILPLISAHFHFPAPVEFKSFRVISNRMKGLIEVAAFTSPPISTFYDPYVIEDDVDSEPELFLSFGGLPQFGDINQVAILGQLCSMLPISNVEFLSISSPFTIRSMNWHDLFQHCTQITTLQASGQGTLSLLQSLAPSEPADRPSGSKVEEKEGKRDNGVTPAQADKNATGGSCTTTATTTLFPRLATLFLRGLDSGNLYGVLINVLQRRIANKSPVETLTIYRCGIPADRVDDLKRHVREFSWDGDEGSYEGRERSAYTDTGWSL
jgi:hypothetical protein